MITRQSVKFLIIIIACSFISPVQAQSAKIITLKDGSVIKGNVLQLADGVYTLETAKQEPMNVSQTTLSVSTENWKVRRDDELGYEFKYPPNPLEPSRSIGDTSFVVGYPTKEQYRNDPLISKSVDKTFWITVGYISQGQLNVMGVTYCGAYPNDTSRCESRNIGGVRATIDWGVVVPFTRITEDGKEKEDSQIKADAWIPHPQNGGIVTFELQPVTPESKEVLYQILTTFRFLN